MIKESVLKYKTNKFLKSNAEKYSVSFNKAKTIGLLFDNDENYKLSKPFIELLSKEGKSVNLLILSHKKEVPTINHYVEKDFNWIGNVTSNKVEQFINKPYDYLFMLNEEIHYLNKYILAASKAKCRVGLHNEENEEFFELMFDNSKKEPIYKF